MKTSRTKQGRDGEGSERMALWGCLIYVNEADNCLDQRLIRGKSVTPSSLEGESWSE